MNVSRPSPHIMNDMCRLCLAQDESNSPIFPEEDSAESEIPLSFRIMACVSVEVSINDGLPTVICDRCLYHVNSWHDFKQLCDMSQATLKNWQKENFLYGDKDVIVKQEPVDSEEDVLEIIDEGVGSQFMVEDIKQEVDYYETDRQDSASVEAISEESCDPLGIPIACTSNSLDVDADVEVIPQTAGDVCHLRITDIKTECSDVIPIGSISTEPTEGRLLRSVLQGKTKMTMYSKKVPAALDESLDQTVKPFHCNICDKSFSYNYLLKRHEKTHKGDRNVCTYCQKGFSSHASLIQHVRLYDGTASIPYSCDHCKEEFDCRTLYLSHTEGNDGSECIVSMDTDLSQAVHDLKEENGQCEVCHEKFVSEMLLRLHMRKEHHRYSCHKCDKTYTNGVALSNHLRSHTNSLSSTRHFCEPCSRTFPTFKLLKKHERTHMKERAAMALIPTEIVSKTSPENVSQANLVLSLPETEIFLDRPIKEELLDPSEVVQDVELLPVEAGNALQSHTCHLCNENFPTVASLRFHLKGVHLHYQCHRCPKVYSSGVALSNHLRSHSLTSFKKHKCLLCLKSFSSVDLLHKHKKIHSAPATISTSEEPPVDPHVSPENLLLNLDVSAFENNGVDEEPLAKRTCSICSLIAASPSALERHMACHSKDKMYICSICNVSMSYASSLQKHYRLIHSKHVELKSIQKTFVAPKKVDVTAVPEAPKQITERLEGTTRSGRRTIFNKTFRMTAQLQQAKLPAPYECKVCHRTFPYRSYFLRHSKIHSNARVFVSCRICLKTFPDIKTLNNHKGVHTRFQLYSCNVCGKSFNGMNAWEKHQRMHQKGFIYSCKLCGKKFLSKAELHEHKKMHIKVKIFTCAICKNSYHSSSALGKHKRRHGHWYASPEASEVSEIELVRGREKPGPKQQMMKASLSKVPIVRQPNPASLAARTTIARAPASRNASHFPSGKRRPFCNICNKTFSRVSVLRKHKRVHERNDVKPLIANLESVAENVLAEENICVICNRVFRDHISLVRHKGWHTRRNLPTFPPAPSQTSGKQPFSSCFVKLEPTPVNAYQCSFCNKTFSTSSALENHVKSHSEINKSGASSEKLKVNPEGEKNGILTSSRRLACKICKKPFDSKKALITHIGWHSRDSHANKSWSYVHKSKPTTGTVDKFSCNVCHKIFSSSLILNKHKKLHTKRLMSSIKVKPEGTSELTKDSTYFSCPVCHRAFKLQKYLQLHMRLHTGEKRFKCNLCPMAYHRSGSLWKHKRTNHAVKLFSCPVCHRRFGLKNQLTKHMEIHDAAANLINTDTVFACSMCDRTFPTLSKYKQHEKSHNV